MSRIILHIDCNKFYASVECRNHPEIQSLPVVVGGSEELRHGIVLTKNEIAASYGIQTAEPLWRAREKCPGLLVIPPNFPLYQAYSKRANEIYYDYTSQIEPFGLDESWLDVTGSQALFGTGEEIAHKIRRRIKKELGITVSIGVSFNKIFAKLGSDYKKPDAVTVFHEGNYKEKVWPLPAETMLFVGPATKKKLNFYGLKTIGDIANADTAFLHKIFGKQGDLLHCYANGQDVSAVKEYGFSSVPKSIGNSSTTPRDMCDNTDVKRVFTALAENVSRRMRKYGVKGNTVTITIRDVDLKSFSRQGKTENFTNLTREIVEKSMELFCDSYNWQKPLRSVGVSVSSFDMDFDGVQLDIIGSQQQRLREEKLEKTIDSLKEKLGDGCITTASLLMDKELTEIHPHEGPSSFYHT